MTPNTNPRTPTDGERYGLVHGERAVCPGCGVSTSNGPLHLCMRYSDARPCVECGAGTVFVQIAAPGTGSGYSCANGHYDGTCRELTIDDVI